MEIKLFEAKYLLDNVNPDGTDKEDEEEIPV